MTVDGVGENADAYAHGDGGFPRVRGTLRPALTSRGVVVVTGYVIIGSAKRAGLPDRPTTQLLSAS
jgi:hypothetical protein